MAEKDSQSNSQERQSKRPFFSQEQYEYLKCCSERQDMAGWNKWREENPDEKVLLRKASLDNAYLLKANLENADLCNAHLNNAYLRRANLENVEPLGNPFGDAGTCFSNLLKNGSGF